MGLTKQSIGMGAVDSGLEIEKQTPGDKIIVITGNPNADKNTLFDNLAGVNQHMGSWPGKTVVSAQGHYRTREHNYMLVDILDTYSLMAYSAKEEVARNFICFDGNDGVAVIRDTTCLECNLNLVPQTMEISNCVLIYMSLMDEATRKNITIDLKGLSEKLGVSVVGIITRKEQSLSQLMKQLDGLVEDTQTTSPYRMEHSPTTERTTAITKLVIKGRVKREVDSRWLALKLLDGDPSLMKELREYLDEDILKVPEVSLVLSQTREHLAKHGITNEILKSRIVVAPAALAGRICRDTVRSHKNEYNKGDRKLDKILASRFTGCPVMIGMLAVVFRLTIMGASYPPQMLADALSRLQDQLTKAFIAMGTLPWFYGLLILGTYRILAWIVSVMPPSMTIFFPLFILLKDSGYLLRIVCGLDKSSKSRRACGEQASTMCMGFGCNAADIIGCRIIGSPRERLIAMITNSFVPCDGRFPTLTTTISMFFAGVSGSAFDSMLSVLPLTLFIVLGVCMTFAVSEILSMTVLEGIPFSFTLELPPHRRPRIDKMIVHSISDRALLTLGEAVAVTAPADLLIRIVANVQPGDITLLAYFSGFLDPFTRLLGMDDMIFMALILGLSTNKIVIPIIIVAYMIQGSFLEFDSLAQLGDLLVNNG